MTARTARVPSLAQARTVTIRQIHEATAIRQRLETAAPFSAYALAYLDAKLFPLARFYEATLGQRWALAMHARGGLGPSTLLLGDASLVDPLIRLHPGLHHALITCEPEHVDKALAFYDLWRPQSMVRMRVLRSAFVPNRNQDNVRRLDASDANELNRLYVMEGDGIWYSGRQIREGIYYGAHIRGRLVAAAGTHIHSQSQRVGVVGNVFTHPDYRGRGLGSAVTSAVSAHLLGSCDLVVLSVDPANRTARQLYERLGYEETGRLVEALSTRRNAYSPMPLLRRLAARWRGDAPGLELVRL